MSRIRLMIVSLALAFAMPFASAEIQVPATIHLEPVSKKGLSRVQARQVLIIVLRHERYKLRSPYFFIEDLSDKNGKPTHPGFLDFGMGYDYPKAGAVDNLGIYSVSILTGDVWETELCKRYTFPALRRIQKIIMKQTGKTMVDEKEQRKGLGCTDE